MCSHDKSVSPPTVVIRPLRLLLRSLVPGLLWVTLSPNPSWAVSVMPGTCPDSFSPESLLRSSSGFIALLSFFHTIDNPILFILCGAKVN